VHTPTEDERDEDMKCVFDHFPKCHAKILLEDTNAKVGGEEIYKQTIRNESLHEISNDSGLRAVNFAISKEKIILKSALFPQGNINKYIWTSSDRKTYNQINHVLIDKGRLSNVFDVRSCRGADYDTDHCLVIVNVRQRA
jgi:hypothetical protein